MNRLSSSVAARGARRILSGVVALAAAVLLVPVGAQSPAKRAMDLEDILSFRAMGTSVLSPNGQWFAYRMSPLQGDSEVFLKGTAADGKEMKFAVGEGAAARRRSQPIPRGRR